MAGPAAAPRAADVLGRVTLVTGKEEFLNERTVSAVRDAVRGYDAEAELAETTAADLSLATLGELAAPSLFSSIRCVTVRNLENLPDESVDGLLGYCAAPAEDVALVLVHGGGQKGSGVLTKLRKLADGHRLPLRASSRPRSSRRSSRTRCAATARPSTRRPRRSWSRPSARTSARCRPRPAS